MIINAGIKFTHGFTRAALVISIVYQALADLNSFYACYA